MKSNDRPIVISFCSGDMVHADFVHSVIQCAMFELLRGRNIGTDNVKTTTLEIGRIRQVTNALRKQCSHILFVDSDMTFPRDTLTRLLTHNVDIVGCTYSMRRSPRMLTHEGLEGDRNIVLRRPRFEVASLGLGCVLVRTSVFKKISRPWFDVKFLEGFDPFDVEFIRSEDRRFCDKAREAGFQVWCDGHLSQEIGHVGTFEFNLNHAEVPYSTL